MTLIKSYYFIGTAKFVEYDRKRGIVFLLNRNKPSDYMTLFCIKLRKGSLDDKDSDDEGNRMEFNSSRHSISYKFSFIREVRLNLNNSVI